MDEMDIQLAIAKYYDLRKFLVVPNVFWGMGWNFEVDVVVATPSKYLHQLEIKISKHDLDRDLKKNKWRFGTQDFIFRENYFVFPDSMLFDCEGLVPMTWGIILIWKDGSGALHVRKHRRAQPNKNARKISEKDLMHLYHLSSLRAWQFMRSHRDLQNRLKRLWEKQEKCKNENEL